MNLVIDSNGSGDRKGGAGSRSGGSGGRRGGSGSRPIIYHIVAVLVLMGLLLSVVTLIVAIASGGGWPSIAGMLATLVAYGCVIFYAWRGYRETDKRYFLGAVYGIAAMLFFKSLVPLHTMLSEALITLGFGLLLVFAERINKKNSARKVLLAALVVLVLEALVVLFMPLGVELSSLHNFLVRVTPLSSVVLTGTLTLMYLGDA